MSGHTPFGELTKDQTPEQRQRIERLKAVAVADHRRLVGDLCCGEHVVRHEPGDPTSFRQPVEVCWVECVVVGRVPERISLNLVTPKNTTTDYSHEIRYHVSSSIAAHQLQKALEAIAVRDEMLGRLREPLAEAAHIIECEWGPGDLTAETLTDLLSEIAKLLKI